MGSQFTGWRFLVNFMLPTPLILTFLLVLPFPRNVRKGLLIFTNKVLSFSVVGGIKLVHFALILAGVPLFDSGMRTYKHAQAVSDSELTPNQKIGLLAKKWREERNFWIAAMAFTLWCLLTVLYAHVDSLLKLEDKVDDLQEQLDAATGVVRPKPTNKMKVAGAVATMITQMGFSVPESVKAAAERPAPPQMSTIPSPAGTGQDKGDAGAPSGPDPSSPAAAAAGLAGFGKKGGNASEGPETEMTPQGEDAAGSGGTLMGRLTRRRAPAATAEAAS